MNDMRTTDIKAGDRVQSYNSPDLPNMKETCFVEGIVEGGVGVGGAVGG